MGCNTSQELKTQQLSEEVDENDINEDKSTKNNQQAMKESFKSNGPDIASKSDDDDEAKAATKIQAVFRGHKVRATMKKSDDMPNQSASKVSINPNNSNDEEPTKEELEAEFDPNDKELCDAALKIQATFRGHLSRKIVNKDPDDVDIEEITKKVAEELDIDLSDPELNKAATKIQASFRGHKTRKDVTN